MSACGITRSVAPELRKNVQRRSRRGARGVQAARPVRDQLAVHNNALTPTIGSSSTIESCATVRNLKAVGARAWIGLTRISAGRFELT